MFLFCSFQGERRKDRQEGQTTKGTTAMTHNNRKEINNGGPHEAADAPVRPAVTFDVERYERYLEDQGLSAEQKRAMLEALWSIIVGFVDLGFGVHPAQSACGQNGADNPDSPAGVRNDLYSNGSTQIIEGHAVVISAAGEVDS
jgi:hypothetical protein